MLVFLWFLEVLEVWGRSGRLQGRISTTIRQKNSGGHKNEYQKSNGYFNVSVKGFNILLRVSQVFSVFLCIFEAFKVFSLRPASTLHFIHGIPLPKTLAKIWSKPWRKIWPKIPNSWQPLRGFWLSRWLFVDVADGGIFCISVH